MAPEYEPEPEATFTDHGDHLSTSFDFSAYEAPPEPTTPAQALLWLLFVVALLCAPAVVIAVYGWAL